MTEEVADPYGELMWRNYDNLFKILIIGNSAVGKTAFLTRFTEDVFTDSFCSTIGIDFRIKTMHKNGKKIKLQVRQISTLLEIIQERLPVSVLR